MIEWFVVLALTAISLIVTIIAGALRFSLRPSDLLDKYSRATRWLIVAQVMWAITGLVVLVIMEAKALSS